MKPMIAAVVVVALSAGCGPRPHRYASVLDAQASIFPRDVKAVEWALSDVTYLKDHNGPKDEWRSCDETLKLGYGDCDDYAVCAYDMTAGWPGCTTKMVVVEGRSALHAITTLKCSGEKNLEGYFDNGAWMKGSAQKFGKKILAVRIGSFLLPAYDWKDIGE